MGATVLTHTGKISVIERKQVIRYLGINLNNVDERIMTLIDKCCMAMKFSIKPSACYMETDVRINGDIEEFSSFKTQSKNLSKVLQGCNKAIIVAATVGPEVDTIIKRAEVTSKADALVYNAVGTAAIEQYMTQLNTFFAEQYRQYQLRPRFSPGYGDLPIEVQRNIIPVLDTKKLIGVALTEKLMMVPSKSVTAIIGLGSQGCTQLDKDCDTCTKTDCEYRLG